MNKNSRIYVAGHTGLVGSALVRSLKERGYNNLVYRTIDELDLTIQEDVNQFFQEERPEYVFLAAARVGGIHANNLYRADFIYVNIMIQGNIIHASYMNGVKKLLFLGSTCIYPRESPQPMKEEYLLTSPLEYTNEPYAIAKIAGIKMCESYNIQYGTNFISVMPTNLYGPGDNFDLETSHVLPAILRKMHLATCLEHGDWTAIRNDLNRRPIRGVNGDSNQDEILKTLDMFGIKSSQNKHKPHAANRMPQTVSLTLWGSGSPLREFLFVDDMADALTFLMEGVDFGTILSKLENPEEIRNTHINIGTGVDISIHDLALIIKEIIDFNGKITYDPSKPDGTPRKLTDVTLLNNLGWKHKTNLEEGIKKLYKWYLEDLDQKTKT